MKSEVESVLAAMISADIPRTSLKVARLTDALLRQGWVLTETQEASTLGILVSDKGD